MTRAHIDYTASAISTRTFDGFDPDVPIAGYYRFKLVSGGHPVAVHIWHGPPHDPDTGEEMDRGWRWQATVNDKPVDLDRVWPKCAEDKIDEAEAKYLTGLQEWAEKHAPNSPQANPNQRINLLTAPLAI
jgi:hypothetical protein